MAQLYTDGKAKIVTTVVSDSWTDHVEIPRGIEVDWLVNEHCDTLVIEGHVDLAEATKMIHVEGGPGFSEPRHTLMRFMSVPDGELNESDDRYGWRGECQRGATGAGPVTIAVRKT